jgi:hypothetical protein
MKYPLLVWDFECKYCGTWRAGKRYCSYKKKWVTKEECENCTVWSVNKSL